MIKLILRSKIVATMTEREGDDEHCNESNERKVNRDEEEDRKNKENSNHSDDGKKMHD